MNRERFGLRVYNARLEMHISTEVAAKKAAITYVYWRQIESGVRTPGLDVFIRICNVLHATPSYLLAEDLENDVPEPYRRALDALLQAPPIQASIIASILETMRNSNMT